MRGFFDFESGALEDEIAFDGVIYNSEELKRELRGRGVKFTKGDALEICLKGYREYGGDFFRKINGAFALALWDGKKRRTVFCRDKIGIKPLYYTRIRNKIFFGSKIQDVLEKSGIDAVVTKEGLCEIFALGPAKSRTNNIFQHIEEVLPAQYIVFESGKTENSRYWQLESHVHEDTFPETVEKTAWLIKDAVKRQMQADVPICTFLSGGIDSSLVTAICAKELKKQGQQLDTFSFDFEGNQKYFKANAFQPSQDRPWVEKMVQYAGTKHRYLECDNEDLVSYLYKAVDAADLPCMADVEGSMLYFCEQTVKERKVVLTGEGADEIFGGYPWFYKEESFARRAFPWSFDMKTRQTLLLDEWIERLPMEEYAREAYEKTIADTPVLEGEKGREKRRREIAYLNLKWFMATLLDRMDRTSRYCNLDARVPFADERIVQYLWNVPWDMKYKNHTVKGLLRFAGEGLLPKDILWRKKSPYPKTYNPFYEKMLGEELKGVLARQDAPVKQFLDAEKVNRFLSSPSDYGKPWYGQLMAGPQMLAYMLQVNYWLEKYKIKIKE
ncbi:MAG: asparagine synthase (glutamine-hydrolyzing) [Blautia sp.]|nr:asparagine synthase (glutamine-hydrolyzing) [Blautia sp.]